MIQKYGKVIIDNEGVIFTDWGFVTEVNHEAVLRWAIHKLIRELKAVQGVKRSSIFNVLDDIPDIGGGK